MASLFDFSKEIAGLRANKKFSEALAYFKKNKSDFTKEEISQNEFIVSDIISCLRHTNNFDGGFKFLSIYDIVINSETKERILTAYGWLLWAKYKAENTNVNDSQEDVYSFEDDEDEIPHNKFHYSKNELLQQIETLIPLLLPLNNNFSKTLISNLFLVVLKSEKRKPAPNWKLVDEFCNQFNPEHFSKECSTMQVKRKGHLRDMELASDLENWYAYKTKALMKLGEYQECFDISKEALEKLDKFHYSNDVWFSRRMALAKKNLGNTEEAIAELETILKRKNEWFIQKELAELYFEKGEIEKSYQFCINSINNFGPLEFKVDLLYLMGRLYQKKNKEDLAFKHFSLSKLIRQSENWKIPPKLFDALHNYSNDEIPLSEIDQLKSELEEHWNSLNSNQKTKRTDKLLKGIVIKIMHDNERGKDGFLKFNDSEIYFSVSANYHLTTKINVETKVGFKIIPASEGKKERAKIIKLID